MARAWVKVGTVAVLAALALAATTASMGSRLAVAEPPPQVQGLAPQLISYNPPPAPSASEMARLRDGIAACEAGDWATLAALRDNANDALVRRILQWRFASAKEAPLDFDAISEALLALQDWPGRAAVKARAEQALASSTLGPHARLAFLDEIGGPESGDGMIAKAIALQGVGRRDEALALAREAWRGHALSSRAEIDAGAAFSFDRDDHAARTDYLLWRGQRTDALRLAARLDPADQALARARVALQTRQRRGLQAAVDAVPASRRDDPGLLYDRTRYVRRAGRPEDALRIAADIVPEAAPAVARDDIFRERRLYVPRALRNGDSGLAYGLVTRHGLERGEEFADAEWVAGWLSLRFLREPGRAAEHFSHLSDRVGSPVSRARAFYWRAEAAKALGRENDARTFLSEAARYPFTYYGQLAAARLGGAMLDLPGATRISDATRARFESRELVRALRLIADIGDRADFESIAFYLDDALDDPDEIEALAEMARARGYARTALRSAKAGLFRNVVAANAAYPILDLPPGATLPGRAEPAFTLAIIRQESEFQPDAVSSARARGLMQLMPATARMQARREGMSYSGPAILTADPDYNVTLGSAHLGDLVSEFGGSYVLAIAAYNAGGHRAREWITDWGDPRSSSVDAVDWIELVPIEETRNYIQRVMENLQVYRHRLAGRPTPITILEDLNRGER
jgi:soluble lytic murein transglycosylase